MTPLFRCPILRPSLYFRFLDLSACNFLWWRWSYLGSGLIWGSFQVVYLLSRWAVHKCHQFIYGPTVGAWIQNTLEYPTFWCSFPMVQKQDGRRFANHCKTEHPWKTQLISTIGVPNVFGIPASTVFNILITTTAFFLSIRYDNAGIW